MSPTQRTLRELRARGYFAAVVEHWNPHARIRQDLFRWIDVVAVKAGEPILGIQTTSGPNAAARVDKARGNPALSHWLRSGGRLSVFAWAKHKRKLKGGGWSKSYVWDLREVDLSLVDVEAAGGPAAVLVSGPRSAAGVEAKAMETPAAG